MTGAAGSTLTASARFWFVMTALGQRIFTAYVAAFYGPRLLQGGPDALEKFNNLANGYIAGDTAGNAAGYREVGSDVTLEGRARNPLDAKPRALKRCVMNLVDNALKFGQRAMIRIDDGEALTISVADEGPGIPEASLEQVFEPFFRLESSRSRDTGGSGLGLSIARDVAQAHGGVLTLRNLGERGLIAELRLHRS